MWENVSAIFSALFALAMMILVLVLAYFTTKAVGRRSVFRDSGTGSIRILDRLALGPDKAFYIVQVAGETMLVGVTQQHIELLCSIDAEKLPEVPAQTAATDFSVLLKSMLKKESGGFGKGKKGNSEDEHESL